MNVVRAALIGGLLVAGSARADLLLESTLNFEAQPLVRMYADLQTQMTYPPSPVLPLNVPHVYSFYLVSPESKYDLGQLPQTPPPKIAADRGNSSFSLCLSALLSLGACRSIRGAKKLPFGIPPKWYHTGGPFQNGRIIVVDLDSVCPVPACCFVQPVHAIADLTPERHFGIIVSLWRTSQFTPSVIVSRGPPDMS